MRKAVSRGTRSAPKSRSTSRETDFPGAFAALRNILQKQAPNLKVVHDTPTKYYLDIHFIGKKNKAPIFFGAAIINKNYVSFHFMPVYALPSAQKKISPQLKKHMQGKACFNFAAPDPELFAELDSLVASSVEPYLSYLKTLG